MIRAVQVSFFADRYGRHPEDLLAAWPALSRVARATREAGVNVSVLQAAAHDAVLERDGVTYHFIRQGPMRTRTALWPRKLIGCAREIGPDVVHIHGLGFPLQTRLLARALPKARIVVQDHCDHPRPGWRRPIQKWGLAAADVITFTEAELAQRFVGPGNLEPSVRILEVLEVSTELTPGDMQDARRSTGVTGDPCFLWVGRLNRNKDPFTILDGFQLATGQLSQARLYLCYTEDALLRDVMARIGSNAVLRERVRLLGKVQHADMEALYRSADFFVLGSAHEGSGFAILEAMACGVTPVVTDIPAFRAITGEEVGELFTHGDVVACANAMIRAAQQDRATQRRRTRARFDRALTYSAIGKQIRDVYEAVLR
jgi:glycosyltransferase involved in cell wall biosynthesis